MNIYIYIYICKSYVYIYIYMCVYITIYTYIIYIYRYVCIFCVCILRRHDHRPWLFARLQHRLGHGEIFAPCRPCRRCLMGAMNHWNPWDGVYKRVPRNHHVNGKKEETLHKIYPSKFGFYFGDFVFTKAYESHESPQIGQVCNIWSLYIDRCHWSPHFLVDMALSFIQLSIPGMESQSPRTIPEVFGFGVSLATSQSSRSQSAVQFEW